MIEYTVVKSVDELKAVTDHVVVFLLKEHFTNPPSGINVFFLVNSLEEVSEKAALLDEDPLLIQELI